jgi:hypothetical protein
LRQHQCGHVFAHLRPFAAAVALQFSIVKTDPDPPRLLIVMDDTGQDQQPVDLRDPARLDTALGLPALGAGQAGG